MTDRESVHAVALGQGATRLKSSAPSEAAAEKKPAVTVSVALRTALLFAFAFGVLLALTAVGEHF